MKISSTSISTHFLFISNLKSTTLTIRHSSFHTQFSFSLQRKVYSNALFTSLMAFFFLNKWIISRFLYISQQSVIQVTLHLGKHYSHGWQCTIIFYCPVTFTGSFFIIYQIFLSSFLTPNFGISEFVLTPTYQQSQNPASGTMIH